MHNLNSEDDKVLVSASEYFDTDWYVEQYPDVRHLPLDAVEHYLWLGARLGRNPSPKFDTGAYLARYADVAEAGENPLVHFLKYGLSEGRHAFPVAKSWHGCKISPQTRLDRYQAWLRVNGPSKTEHGRLADALHAAGRKLPRLSLVVPVYRPVLQHLDEAVRSVLDQIYQDWELCLHVDGDPDERLRDYLLGLEVRDARIRCSIGTANVGISAATNAAARLATGEYLCFLDQDDILEPTALAHIALAAVADPDADMIYSDDDKIDDLGTRYAPQFKPDWSPVLLLSYMYMSHFLVVRRSLFQALGGLRSAYDGAQDYDLVLRAAERDVGVAHVPAIIYHWRAVPGSTASSGAAKPYSLDAGRRAVEDACRRRGIPAGARHPQWAAKANIGVYALDFDDQGPTVTIVIPTRNRIDLLRPCVSSIERLTTYRNYRILIVDNDSDDPETLSFMASCGHQVVRIGNPDGRFSFAHLMNEAARIVDTDYLLLLNNDTTVRSPGWLSQMVGYAQMPGVGAVGAKLYYPDDTIQHAGVVHGPARGLAAHALRLLPEAQHGPLAYAMVAREYSAVTAACVLTPTETFRALGGFDGTRFRVGYNDVDFGFRLCSRGLSSVYCASAELTHYEGKSRGTGVDDPMEEAEFRSVYRDFRDRSYNPNYEHERHDEIFETRPWKYAPPELFGRPIRTAVVSHNLNHEGAPNVLFEVVKGLVETGTIEPVVLSAADGPLRAEYEALGIRVEIVDRFLREASDPKGYQRGMEAFARHLAALDVELVDANTAETFWAIDAAQRAGIPSVWTIHESGDWHAYFDDRPDFLREIAYSAFAVPYRVVFVSGSACDQWDALRSAHNFAIVHNGLDTRRLRARTEGLDRDAVRRNLGIDPQDVLFVMVGTVCERKNQRLLVKALAESDPGYARRMRVLIVGDRPGDYSRELHEEIARLPGQWQTRVEVVAETDNPYPYFLAADVALCISLVESFPRVVQEAMAFGLPLIVTPMSGIVEQASDGLNATFVPQHSAAELALAMAELADDDAKRRLYAKNSRLLFERMMHYDGMIERYAAIFREASISTAPAR